jgi:hypothetical protein
MLSLIYWNLFCIAARQRHQQTLRDQASELLRNALCQTLIPNDDTEFNVSLLPRFRIVSRRDKNALRVDDDTFRMLKRPARWSLKHASRVIKDAGPTLPRPTG